MRSTPRHRPPSEANSLAMQSCDGGYKAGQRGRPPSPKQREQRFRNTCPRGCFGLSADAVALPQRKTWCVCYDAWEDVVVIASSPQVQFFRRPSHSVQHRNAEAEGTVEQVLAKQKKSADLVPSFDLRSMGCFTPRRCPHCFYVCEVATGAVTEWQGQGNRGTTATDQFRLYQAA